MQLPCARTHSDAAAKLYVVTPVINPCRYRSRYSLYRNFEKMVADGGAELYTVEAAFGNRPFAVTEAGNPRHLQLRTCHELWHKENMLNLAIQALPRDWEYVAWVDADVSFARPDWAAETIHQLQHFHVVQMFSRAEDLSPHCDPIRRHTGFVYSYCHGLPSRKGYTNWHPGFAWAARREAIDALGGLIDTAILGAGDRHMAFGLIGKMGDTIQPGLTAGYSDVLMRWEARAEKHIKRNIGYVPGLLLHHWHGKKRDRRYFSRWDILVRNGYDPNLDLIRDWQGLWHLTDRSMGLRDDIRNYFRARNEDSIDFEEGNPVVTFRAWLESEGLVLYRGVGGPARDRVPAQFAEGEHWTPDEDVAATYGDRVLTQTVHLRNPYTLTLSGRRAYYDDLRREFGTHDPAEVTRFLQRRGHDALVVKNVPVNRFRRDTGEGVAKTTTEVILLR